LLTVHGGGTIEIFITRDSSNLLYNNHSV